MKYCLVLFLAIAVVSVVALPTAVPEKGGSLSNDGICSMFCMRSCVSGGFGSGFCDAVDRCHCVPGRSLLNDGLCGLTCMRSCVSAGFEGGFCDAMNRCHCVPGRSLLNDGFCEMGCMRLCVSSGFEGGFCDAVNRCRCEQQNISRLTKYLNLRSM